MYLIATPVMPLPQLFISTAILTSSRSCVLATDRGVKRLSSDREAAVHDDLLARHPRRGVAQEVERRVLLDPRRNRRRQARDANAFGCQKCHRFIFRILLRCWQKAPANASAVFEFFSTICKHARHRICIECIVLEREPSEVDEQRIRDLRCLHVVENLRPLDLRDRPDRLVARGSTPMLTKGSA